MPSLVVPPFANSGLISLAASDKIAVFSVGAFKVYQRGSYVNAPDADTLLTDTPAGSAMYTSSAVSAAAEFYIDAYGGFPVYYEVGASAVVKQGRLLSGIQTDPVAVNATGAVSAAAILGGIVTSTTAAAVAGTIPTGTVMDASSEWAVNEFVDWSVINTGPDNFTVTAATGHTVVGGNGAAIVVPTLSAAYLRTRKTAANTFVTYSLGRFVS